VPPFLACPSALDARRFNAAERLRQILLPCIDIDHLNTATGCHQSTPPQNLIPCTTVPRWF
jgi:hypothetical protein